MDFVGKGVDGRSHDPRNDWDVAVRTPPVRRLGAHAGAPERVCGQQPVVKLPGRIGRTDAAYYSFCHGDGKLPFQVRQPSMRVASTELPRSGRHRSYQRLNRVLEESGLDALVEEQWTKSTPTGSAGGVWRRGCTSGCWCSTISRAWTRNGRLRGDPLIN